MAPQSPALFGVAPNLLHNIFDVGSREAYDATRGVKPGTLASMLNRAHNPQFGAQGSWINPGQYAVLQSKGLDPRNPNIAKAQAYYSSPQGQQELAGVANQLGGVTDFRSTSYLKGTGGLLKYPTNLIPTVVQGERRFVTPQQLKQLGTQPDLSENTFFNETQRPPTSKWWQPYMQGQQQAQAPVSTQAPSSVDDTLSAALGFRLNPSEQTPESTSLAANFADKAKQQVLQQLFTPGGIPGINLPGMSGLLASSQGI
jgi:hypothetical protein